jgi:CheY-like chemotaxis protein
LRLLREDADKVDLLFTDVMMPGPNGFQVAEEALALRPQLKVLFASGYAADVLPPQQRFEWRLLAKPYRPADLAREVRALLAAE